MLLYFRSIAMCLFLQKGIYSFAVWLLYFPFAVIIILYKVC